MDQTAKRWRISNYALQSKFAQKICTVGAFLYLVQQLRSKPILQLYLNTYHAFHIIYRLKRKNVAKIPGAKPHMYPFVTVSKSTIFVSAHGCLNSKMVNGTNSEYLPKIVLDFQIQVKAPISSFVVQKTVSNDYCSVTLNYNDAVCSSCFMLGTRAHIFALRSGPQKCTVLLLLCIVLCFNQLKEIVRDLSEFLA